MRSTSRSVSQICQQAEALITKNNQPGEALQLLKPLLAKKIRPAKAAKWAGIAYVLLDQAASALPLLKEALKSQPKDPSILMGIGECYLYTERPEQAEPWLLKALKVKPHNVNLLVRLGQAYRAQNKFEDQRQVLSQALQLDPKQTYAWFNLAQHLSFTDCQDERVQQLHQLEQQQATLPSEELAALYSTLGKVYQDLNQPDRAFGYYQQSNELQKSLSPKPTQSLSNFVKAYQAFYTPNQTAQLRQRQGLDYSPEVFIIGMSRSGKSLVESLLACHPSVTAGGEDKTLIRFAARIAKNQENVARYLQEEAARIRRDALAYLDSRSWPEKGVITNTLPNNIQPLGLLAAWLPQSPIIFITRSLDDLGLAIYFKHYKDDITYTLDLYETGREIAFTEALMDFWISVLPNPCVKLRYEDLVQKPAQVSKALYQFLDLDWKAEYFSGLQQQRHLAEHLAPHQSLDAPAPIRNDYIGWSKPYEKFLAPLRKGYQDALAEVEASKKT